MKTLEELAAVDTTTITEMLPRVISRAVELKAREILLGRNLLRRNTDILVPKPGKSVFLPIRSQITAQEFAEGADMSAVTPEGVTYADTVEVTPTKFGVPLKITQEAIDAAQHDVIRDNIDEAGYAMALLEDTRIMNEIFGVTTVTDENVAIAEGQTDGVLAQSPVLAITSITVPGGYTLVGVNYKDGKIRVTPAAGVGGIVVTVSYIYASGRNYHYIQTGTTHADLTYKDILAAQAEVLARKERPNFLILDAAGANLLQKDLVGYLTFQAGEGAIRVPGEIGAVGSLRVAISGQVPAGNGLIIATERAGWIVDKRDLTTKREDEARTDSIRFYITRISAAKITMPDALIIVGGMQSNAIYF
ncbi:MAG TPA: hypothetical protein G4O03_01740 [Dehalococcoidia bacterium]|nr:hypothetical protein [Dehalococcoidia bacterium]